MKNILFLCTGNSCRSQMAEGWGRHLMGNQFNFFSAGTKKSNLNPFAIEVMKEAGVDISAQSSKAIGDLPDIKMDFIFTLCSDANENCPFFPGGKIFHVGFDDPPRLTYQMTDQKEIVSVYRRVRDEIKNFIENIHTYLNL